MYVFIVYKYFLKMIHTQTFCLMLLFRKLVGLFERWRWQKFKIASTCGHGSPGKASY